MKLRWLERYRPREDGYMHLEQVLQFSISKEHATNCDTWKTPRQMIGIMKCTCDYLDVWHDVPVEVENDNWPIR